MFLSKKLDENVKNNMLNLDSHISNDCYTIEDIVVEDDSEHYIFENTDNKTICQDKSPFGRHFDEDPRILQIDNVTKYDSSNESNPDNLVNLFGYNIFRKSPESYIRL